MILPSRYNVALAKAAYSVLTIGRRIIGLGDISKVRRGGVNWVLDLREGLDLTIYVTGFFERGVSRACYRLIKSGNIALDIGASMGAHTLHMAVAVGSSGRVIAIEPTSYPLARLKNNLAANLKLSSRVQILNALVVASPGQQIPPTIQSGWKLIGDIAGTHPISMAVPEDTTGAESIMIDELVTRENLKNVDFIKIDVDGAENDVIVGGEWTITSFRPIILLEVQPYTLIERGLPGDAPVQLLKRMGYQFETLNGTPLSLDYRRWVDAIPHGFSRNIVAQPRLKRKEQNKI